MKVVNLSSKRSAVLDFLDYYDEEVFHADHTKILNALVSSPVFAKWDAAQRVQLAQFFIASEKLVKQAVAAYYNGKLSSVES
ncbi:hypothetical protein LX64_01157 [Chitinophaga skermanii]|uniref:Uncharacterized protein n=1 Tax=Chitinophaga skermanii TaxID=331697 RepID=A0A327QXP8_9BACT|nr:hypothetical protein [Chitinophaga skermanii]RAJ08504.1 hypothetical protein LX64_01157 [Chitinophaga skermanii]